MPEMAIGMDSAALLQLIDQLTTAIILVDRDRRVILANEMARQFSAATEAGVRGLRGGELLGCVNATNSPLGCGTSAACHLCLVKNKVVESFATRRGSDFFDARMTLRDIGPRELRVSTRHLRLDGERCVLISMLDVTEDHEKARLAAANAQLRTAIETAGAACHELSQPLMILSGRLDLLMETLAADDPLAGQLARMQQDLGRINAVTHRLMRINTYQTKTYAGISRILDLERSAADSGSQASPQQPSGDGDLPAGEGRPA